MLVADWFLSGLRISLPLIFAALGGLLCEKSGVANIALEAFILFTSFTAAASLAITGNLPLSIFVAIMVSACVGVVFAFFTVTAKSDQIIVGTGLNILALGAIPILSKSLFGSSGQTPSLPLDKRLSELWIFVSIAILALTLIVFIFKKLPFGVRLIAAGDNPSALKTQGVSVSKVRWLAILIGSVLCAWSGIYLSIGAGSGYTRNMSAGRGYIALAALIFGRWKPVPTVLTCFAFGLLDALQIFLQSSESIKWPTQLTMALPYITTLLALGLFSSKNFAPKFINK